MEGILKTKKLANFLTVGPWVDVNKANSLNSARRHRTEIFIKL